MIEELKKRLNNPDSLVSLFLGIAVVIVIGVMLINYTRGKQSSNKKTDVPQVVEQNATGSAAMGTTYTVKTGETLWSIAASTIGSGYNWVDIQVANKLTDANAIEVGQKLEIPKVAKREPGQIANASVEVKKPADGKYTVQKGDSLWTISMKTYGTGFRWTEIAKTNNIVDPNLIFTGSVLMLP